LLGARWVAVAARLERVRDIVAEADPRGLDLRTAEERVGVMFGFMRRSAPRPPSDALGHAIESDGLPPWIGSATMLRVVESRGRYSGRKVTYIRVFDPVLAAERSLVVKDYKDLDAQPELILRTGHIESDGIVILNRHGVDVDSRRPSMRTRAGRPVADAAVIERGNEERSAAGSTP
jgi:hypothetical protein